MTLRDSGNKTVPNDRASIEAEVNSLVNLVSEGFSDVDADQEIVDDIERVGDRLVGRLEDATIIEDTHTDGDHHDSEDGEQVDHDGDHHDEDDDGDGEDDLRERVIDLEDTTRVHENRLDAHSKGIEKANFRLEDLEDACGPQGANGQNTDPGRSVEPETHLEQIARLPQRVTEDERENVRRALFVARDVTDYTKKVPAGYKIEWSELKRVLAAGMDVQYGATVGRVMEILDEFGEDTVKIVDKPRHQKMVVFDEDAVERLHILCQHNETNSAVSGVTT